MRVLFVTLFIVIIDQLSKLYVKGISIPKLGIEINGMQYQSSVNVFGDFFKITFIENPGMAFGLQIGGKLFLSIFTILATILLLIFLYRNRHESLLLRLALAFILGGAIGNLIDRVFYGKIYGYAPLFYGRVVDFLHLDFPNFTVFGKTIYSWPIFNAADISVSVGFMMILFGYKKIFHPAEKESLVDNQPFPLDHSFIDTGNSIEEDHLEKLKLDPAAPEDSINKTTGMNTGSEINERTDINNVTGSANSITEKKID